MPTPSDSSRTLLRHALATLSYRGAKTLRDAPPGFAAFKPGPTARTPLEIVAHLGDLFDWSLHLCRGEHVWKSGEPREWADEVARFFEALRRLDEYLASDAPIGYPLERLFQGPVADALTHVGQLSMLRRLAGAPIRGENYFKADIAAGRIGLDQAAPKIEFD
jgi:hypothetical protein